MTQLDEERRAWAYVCAAYHDILIAARRVGLADVRPLGPADRPADGDLNDWIMLQAAIADREGDVDDYARQFRDAGLLVRGPSGDDDEDDDEHGEYGCPTSRRCARREPAIAGKPPTCELGGRPMVKG